jgi:hypothetical protein
MKHTEQLKVLRQRVPISITQGLDLLDKLVGDADSAEKELGRH